MSLPIDFFWGHAIILPDIFSMFLREFHELFAEFKVKYSMKRTRIPQLYKDSGTITVESAEVFSFYTHSHAYCEMTLYEPFDGAVIVNNKTIGMDTITAVLIAPSDFHRIEVAGEQNAGYIKVAFDSDLFGEEKPIEATVILQNIGEQDFVVHLFREIARNRQNSAYTKQLAQTAVCALLEKGNTLLPSNPAEGGKLINRALRIIHERFNEELTLSSLAKELSVSPQYLSGAFKKNTGATFLEHLNGMRLHYAACLLLETQEHTSVICERCGYRNLSHFLRSFKKMFGVSTGVYRKNSGSLSAASGNGPEGCKRP